MRMVAASQWVTHNVLVNYHEIKERYETLRRLNVHHNLAVREIGMRRNMNPKAFKAATIDILVQRAESALKEPALTEEERQRENLKYVKKGSSDTMLKPPPKEMVVDLEADDAVNEEAANETSDVPMPDDLQAETEAHAEAEKSGTAGDQEQKTGEEERDGDSAPKQLLREEMIPSPQNSPNAGNKENEAALGTETQMPETQAEATPEGSAPETEAPQESVEQEQAPDRYAGLSQEEIDVQEGYDLIEQEEEEAQKQRDQEEQAAQQEKDAAAEKVPIVDDRDSTQAEGQAKEAANQTGDSDVVMTDVENRDSTVNTQSPDKEKSTKKSKKVASKPATPTKRSKRIQKRKEHQQQMEKESDKNIE